MNQRYQLGDTEYSIDTAVTGQGMLVQLPDGSQQDISIRRLADGMLEITRLVDGKPAGAFRAATARTERGIEVSWHGDVFVFSPVRPGQNAEGRKNLSGTLTASMPGIVVDLLVSEGDVVAANAPLAVVEAMKVMVTLEAPFAGTVSRVHVEKGQQVKLGETLIELTPLEA
jgi:biotin carboxyl carrier protein